MASNNTELGATDQTEDINQAERELLDSESSSTEN